MTDGFFFVASNALKGDLADKLGAQHYSYGFASRKFAALFRHRGVPLTVIDMPEYYGTRAAFPDRYPIGDAQLLHLIFRSTEEIRLLKFGHNICCFAWEFDVIKDHTGHDEHPFLNQKRMLSLCDEIWVPSSYTQQVLEAHGVPNVHRIPAPIPVSTVPRRSRAAVLDRLGEVTICPLAVHFLLPHAEAKALCASRERTLADWLAERPDATIYLSVLNPEDFRKNLDAMIRGFHHFSEANPSAVLVIKALTSKARYPLAQVVSDVVRNKLASGTVLESDRVVFFTDYLEDDAMSDLYDLADFYLCTSVAEGQNLPLLEAMARGVVPVTTRHTAMLDYIDGENAVVMRSPRIPNDCEHFAATATGKPFEIQRASFIDVHEALLAASALTVPQRADMAARCIDRVAEQYSFEAVWPLVSQRLSAIAGA